MATHYSLFETRLRYRIIVWGGIQLQRLLVIQTRAVRKLKGVGTRVTCREAFRELEILFTIKSGQARTGYGHPYNTRHRSNFLLNNHHLSLFEKKPSYRGAMFFNNVPDFLKRLPEKNFETSLTDWLQGHPIFTIQEFLQW